MKKLLMIAMLAAAVAPGYAIAQETGGETPSDTTEGANAGNESSTADTTSAPNAPFLGNRDILGTFYMDDGMTTLRSGDEFTSAYDALTDEQRTAIVTECQAADDSQRPFCDAFTAAGNTAAQ